jgi:hypothetical protein
VAPDLLINKANPKEKEENVQLVVSAEGIEVEQGGEFAENNMMWLTETPGNVCEIIGSSHLFQSIKFIPIRFVLFSSEATAYPEWFGFISTEQDSREKFCYLFQCTFPVCDVLILRHRQGVIVRMAMQRVFQLAAQLKTDPLFANHPSQATPAAMTPEFQAVQLDRGKLKVKSVLGLGQVSCAGALLT